MGYLHEGHLSLARRARDECSYVAVSIFVNPTQFGPNEDLSKYPRDLEHDLHLLESADVDLVWTPTPEDDVPVGLPDVGRSTGNDAAAWRVLNGPVTSGA